MELKHYNNMRLTIGISVILFSFLSLLFGLIGEHFGINPTYWWISISDTYHGNSKAIMISTLTIASFFFCTYPGYDWKDRIINLISGIGCMGIILFPCNNPAMDPELRIGLLCLKSPVSMGFHLGFTILAFIGFFINEMFLFTKSTGEKTKKKKIRNRIYRICASCIILCAAILITHTIFNIGPMNTIMIAEMIALVPCGFAWLVKGYAFKFLND